jgi:para-aminobenzoate synthetase/4-amino-4-deoxychorismate lyase
VAQPTGALVYGAGGGITWSSDPAAEDAEVIAKARVLIERRPPIQLIETMLLDADGVRNRADHLHRLTSSASWFGFRFDATDVAGRLDELGCPSGAHRVRLLLARNGAVSVTAVPLDAAPPVVRLAVATLRVRSDDVFCLHKTTNRAVYEAARAAHPDVDDVLLVNERGEVVETTIANVLYRRHDAWWVPPLASGGLDGIGRRVELRSGRVRERVLPAEELGSCEAFAVVSSLRGVRPATLHRGG